MKLGGLDWRYFVWLVEDLSVYVPKIEEYALTSTDWLNMNKNV